MSQLQGKISFILKIHQFIITAILSSLLVSFSCSAQEISSFNYQNIGKKLVYLEDKSGTMALKDIETVSDSAFKKGEQEILNFGNTSSAWWLKISYRSQPHLPVYLIIDAPNIEYITAYTTDNQGKTVVLKTGSFLPKSAGVIIGNNFMLKLPVTSEKEEKMIYLRLKTNNILLAPIKLATAESVMTGQDIKLGIEYIYIGLLIGLLLFNLFLFISVRDVTYLYYVLYVLTLSSYLLIYIRGYGFVFGDDLRIIFNRYPHVLLSFSVIASLLFCNKFLHLKHTAPKMKKLFYLIGIFGICLFFVSILGFKHTAAAIAQFLTVTVAVVAWIAGVIAYRNGHQPAKYYILAWFFIWVTVAIVTLSLGGVITPSEFTIQLVPIGSTIELLLLSFALGDRYKVIMQAEQEARDENLLLVKTQNQRLEISVCERTLQLNVTINELEASNAIKNKLFSIIAHDLRSPLNSLMGILSLSDMKALTPEELRELLAENKKTIKSINTTLNNLLHWAQGQMNGLITHTESFELKGFLEELLLLYMPLVNKKDIRLHFDMESNSLVLADQNQINLVLRNLIDNAIKFTPLSGQIVFSIQTSGDEVLFAIENEIANKLEVDTDSLLGDKIVTSTLGTQNERGVGLGLLLCKEYIKNNGGKFHTSLNGDRIKFSFTLPVPKA